MKLFRQVASLFLGSAIGFLLGGILGGILTFYVYFIGSWIGAPVGAVLGGWFGFRTALRNTTLLFVACFGGMLIGIELAKQIGNGKPKDNFLYGFLDMILPVVMILLSGFLCLIFDQLVPFHQRRGLAIIASSLSLCWLLWELYRYAYVWQPG